MNKNPYDVLGVSPNASDDEIKRVYRDLTRKYHPDANVNNPLADLAEEKFKEVQEAYDIIMRERANGGNSYGNNYGYGSSESYSYGNQNSSYGYGTMDPKLQAAANYINSRRYREAINTLDQVQQRSAMWYYLSGCANAGIGNQILARDHAAQAVNMEPNNMQFRQLLNQLDLTAEDIRIVRMVEAMHREDRIPVVQEICAATYGLRTHCVNVWEAISAHACKSKTNSIRRPSACSDCRMHGTWKRDRDEYIVFAGSSGIWGRDCYPRVWTSHRSCFLSGSSVIRISCHAK